MTKMSFLTLDNRQRHVANTVGFGVRLEIFGMTGDWNPAVGLRFAVHDRWCSHQTETSLPDIW